MDAGNMLKPALARGELHCVGATTLDELPQDLEKDAALERRFQKVMVNEPSVEDTIAILRGLQERYEVHHGVDITDPAIVAAATLSHRYTLTGSWPDKAIEPDRRGGCAHPHGDRLQAEGADRARAAHYPAKIEQEAPQKGRRRGLEETPGHVGDTLRALEKGVLPISKKIWKTRRPCCRAQRR